MPVQIFDKECYEDLWRKLLPGSYTQPIEDEAQGHGFDIPAAQAAIMEFFEMQLNLSQQSYFLKPHSIQTGPIATSATKAVGTVTIRRAAPALGELILDRGTVLEAFMTDSFGGQLLLGRYLLTTPLTIPEGTGVVADVPVEAEFQGYTGNLQFPDQVVEFEELGRLAVPSVVLAVNELQTDAAAAVLAPIDQFNDSLVGRYFRFVGGGLASENVAVPRRITDFISPDRIRFDPPLDNALDVGLQPTAEIEEYSDLGLTVESSSVMVGGTSNALGAIGDDRRQGKVPNESDDAFRARICDLADIISPAAIIRIVDRILTPLGIPFRLKETADIESLMGFTWDIHPYDVGDLSEIVKLPGSQLIGQGFVWLSETSLRRFFIICVGRRNTGEFGAAYDSTFFFSGFANAWDVFAFDGFAIGFDAAIGQVWEAVNQARAAGVGFIIVIDPNL